MIVDLQLTHSAVQHLDDFFNDSMQTITDSDLRDTHWRPDVDNCPHCREIGEQVHAFRRQIGNENAAEMPDNLRYSERVLWERTPGDLDDGDSDVRKVLRRLSRYRRGYDATAELAKEQYLLENGEPQEHRLMVTQLADAIDMMRRNGLDRTIYHDDPDDPDCRGDMWCMAYRALKRTGELEQLPMKART